MEQLNTQLKNALPDLPHPSASDYESRRLHNEILKHDRLQLISECEKQISKYKTDKETRKSKLLEKAKTKEHVELILCEFNKHDDMYIQLLERLYNLKKQIVLKTRSEILKEKQELLEKLVSCDT